MQTIKSFEVDHRKLKKGIYVSRIDGDIITYDLRFVKPNSGSYMDNETLHTIEHLLAVYARNSAIRDKVIYFGPMGCMTGFYLLLRDSVSKETVLETVRDILNKAINHTGRVFGASEIECGNYRMLNLEKAQKACREYLSVIENAADIPDYDDVNKS